MKVYTILLTISSSCDETSSSVIGIFKDKNLCDEFVKNDLIEQLEEYGVEDESYVLKHYPVIDQYETKFSDDSINESIQFNYVVEEHEFD